jgi:acetylornithine deacetylase
MDYLKTLIAFDSVSRNSNLDLIEWARSVLETAGGRTRVTLNKARNKANLFATFGDINQAGGLVLSGHTDVVPVDGQVWRSDPFAAEIRDERLYGRGACDMKGFCAVVLAMAPELAGQAVRAPLHVAFSYDEELGCIGIPDLLDDLIAADIRPRSCIVGEPTSMRLIGAHKGGALYRCRVCGSAAHSSLAPHAVNAVEYAGRLLTMIQQMGDAFREEGPFDPGFDVPHNTISANVIQGGIGSNIIPALCEFMFEYRYLPDFDPAPIIVNLRAYAEGQLLPRMRAVAPEASIVFESLAQVPGLSAPPDSAVFTSACAQLTTNSAEKVAFGTEAGFFQAQGIPTIVCGPGSIEQAHKADEFVPIAELAACEAFLGGMVRRLLA